MKVKDIIIGLVVFLALSVLAVLGIEDLMLMSYNARFIMCLFFVIIGGLGLEGLLFTIYNLRKGEKK